MKQNNKLSAFFLGGDVKKDCFKELFMSKYITNSFFLRIGWDVVVV